MIGFYDSPPTGQHMIQNCYFCRQEWCPSSGCMAAAESCYCQQLAAASMVHVTQLAMTFFTSASQHCLVA